MTDPTPLSPAAQAVLDATNKAYDQAATVAQGTAAALRAAAEQVVPEEQLYGGDQRWALERDARQTCRDELLAIAAELEGAQ